jgi:hypothetical protein
MAAGVDAKSSRSGLLTLPVAFPERLRNQGKADRNTALQASNSERLTPLWIGTDA